MQLNEYLKELRQTRGITQQALADAVGVSKQAVSKWEKGTASPDIMLIPKLAECLRVRPQSIMEVLWGKELEVCTFTFACNQPPVFKAEKLTPFMFSQGNYRMRCSVRTYDRILKKYGARYGIKTLTPLRKVSEILQQAAPTHENYTPEEIFCHFRDECCSRWCGVAYEPVLSEEDAEMGRRTVIFFRKTLASAYKKILNYEAFLHLYRDATTQEEFDARYRQICDILLEEEDVLRSQAPFADTVTCRSDARYLSPHFVLQAIFSALYRCRQVCREDPAFPFVHIMIPFYRAQVGFDSLDLSRYSDYLLCQEGALRFAEAEGTTRLEQQIAAESRKRQRRPAIRKSKQGDPV